MKTLEERSKKWQEIFMSSFRNGTFGEDYILIKAMEWVDKKRMTQSDYDDLVEMLQEDGIEGYEEGIE